MPRAERIWFPGAVYHIIQRGNNQQEIFTEEGDFIWFLRTAIEVRKEMPFHVHAYALMSNHYHMIVGTEGEHISRIMHALNSRYATRFNTKHHRNGHLFQGRFRGILVDKDNYLLELSRYVHLNPVMAGLAQRPGDYPWSSYRFYASGEKDQLVETGLILGYFENYPPWKGRGYADYVGEKLATIREEKDWLQGSLKRQRFLGDKAFVKAMLQKGA